jgi:DNA repair protein RadC
MNALKGVRIRKRELTSPGLVAEIGRAILAAEHDVDRCKEHFWILGLNTRNLIIYCELVGLGTLNAALVHPREVFRFAILNATASIMLMHNHPSGCPDPSIDDIKLTERLRQAGEILGIKVLDHVVVGNGFSRYKSFLELGLMSAAKP